MTNHNDHGVVQDIAQEIDNPGGGDCAFYSFAIGLMPYLQKELAAPDETPKPIWKKIETYLSSSGTDALAIDNFKRSINTFDYRQPDKNFLFTFAMLLRNISFSEKVKAVESALQPKEDPFSETILSDAVNCFRYYFDEARNRRTYGSRTAYYFATFKRFLGFHTELVEETRLEDTDFSRDMEFRKFAKDKANEVIRGWEVGKKGGKELGADEEMRYITQFIMAISMAGKPISSKESTVLSEASILRRVLAKKLQPGVWGTAADIGVLASFFDISLTINTPKGPIPFTTAGKPKLQINNFSQAHWTTSISASLLPRATPMLSVASEAVPPAQQPPLVAHEPTMLGRFFRYLLRLDTKTTNTTPASTVQKKPSAEAATTAPKHQPEPPVEQQPRTHI